jgi:hypothetical protein
LVGATTAICNKCENPQNASNRLFSLFLVQ